MIVTYLSLFLVKVSMLLVSLAPFTVAKFLKHLVTGLYCHVSFILNDLEVSLLDAN